MLYPHVQLFVLAILVLAVSGQDVNPEAECVDWAVNTADLTDCHIGPCPCNSRQAGYDVRFTKLDNSTFGRECYQRLQTKDGPDGLQFTQVNIS